jgi:hypothetical protein
MSSSPFTIFTPWVMDSEHRALHPWVDTLQAIETWTIGERWTRPELGVGAAREPRTQAYNPDEGESVRNLGLGVICLAMF